MNDHVSWHRGLYVITQLCQELYRISCSRAIGQQAQHKEQPLLPLPLATDLDTKKARSCCDPRASGHPLLLLLLAAPPSLVPDVMVASRSISSSYPPPPAPLSRSTTGDPREGKGRGRNLSRTQQEHRQQLVARDLGLAEAHPAITGDGSQRR
jgi:hypothetical protein